MTDQDLSRPPLVLIASGQEWGARALQSTLGPQAFAVLQAFTGRQVLDQVRRGRPDLIILSDDFQDMSAVETCRTIRTEKLITRSTAVLLVGGAPIPRDLRMAALRVGMNDCLGLPMDGEELGLRLMTYIRAKFDADMARELGLVDQPTGLYNAAGTTRRARELGNLAYRHNAPLACVVFSAESVGAKNEEEMAEAVLKVAEALNQAGRLSDAIGRTGEKEFAVFAPETDAQGAERLATRLREAVRRHSSATPTPQAGIFAVPNYRLNPMEPDEMLKRATAALRPFTLS